jgi:hypothetical protein
MRKISLILFCGFGVGWAVQYSPSLGVLDSIQYYVALADTGDTVNIPAGTWEWKIEASNTPSLTLPKPILLRGSGHTQTIIIGDTSSISGESCIYSKNTSSRLLRISGIKFTRYRYSQGGTAAITVGNKNWRIDHCVFDTSNGAGCRGIQATGEGLIDSCYFYSNTQGIKINGVVASSDVVWEGDSLWSAVGYDTLGTSHAVYIEDCKFYYSALFDGAFDAYVGKMVFRNNYVNGTNIGWHGYDSGPRRSALGWEIYDNTFVWSSENTLFCAVNVRGGSGVIYNNSFSGIIGSTILLQNYRTTRKGPDNDTCNGSAVIDGNVLPNGWPCFDQVGRGVNQLSTPLYSWNNTKNGTAITPTVSGTDTAHIKINRDYYTSEKPGYVAYTYPHPARGGIAVNRKIQITIN